MSETKLKQQAMDYGGAWIPFTPTLGNITLGSGTNTGKYCRVGNIIFFSVRIILAANSSLSTGDTTISLPVNNATVNIPVNVVFQDSGTAQQLGYGVISAGTVYVLANKVDGTYATQVKPTSTIPFTWANTDEIIISGSYEAA